jgi:hypothetical protein
MDIASDAKRQAVQAIDIDEFRQVMTPPRRQVSVEMLAPELQQLIQNSPCEQNDSAILQVEY